MTALLQITVFFLIFTCFTVSYGKHIYVFGGYNGIERKHHGEVYSLDTGKFYEQSGFVTTCTVL